MSRIYKVFYKTFIMVALVKSIDIIKNIIVASYIGVTNSADIYAGVISIPDGILVLVGIDSLRGVVNSEYSSLYSGSGTESINESFNNLFKIVSVVAIPIMLIMMFFNETIINLLLPGFDEFKKNKAYSIALIIFPLILIKGEVAILQSAYNSLKNFTFPILVQASLSICILISIFFPPCSDDIIFNISYAILIGHIILLMFLLGKMGKLGLKLNLNKIRLDPVTQKVILSCGAISIIVFVNQLYLYSRNFFASEYGEGAISSLMYGATIPTAIIVIIFGTVFSVLLSDLSSSFSTEKKSTAKKIFLDTFEIIAFIIVPLVGFLIVFGKEILTMVYLRGNMTTEDIDRILKPYNWEALSMLSWVLFIIPTSLYLAKKEYKLLTILGSSVYTFGIILNYILTKTLGYYGISVSTFITLGIYGFILFLYARKFFGRYYNFINTNLFVLASGVSASIITYFLKTFLTDNNAKLNFLNSLIISICGFVFFSIVYLLTSKLLKVNYLNKITLLLKNKYS